MDSLSVPEAIEFNAEKRVRKAMFMVPHLICELVCYEPGQGTPVHHHPRQDEIFYVVEGDGTITVEGESCVAGPGTLLVVPANKRHGMAASAGSRWVVLFFKGPGSSLS